MNDGHNFSYLAELPTKARFQTSGGHPMEVSSSNGSASSAHSQSTTATTVSFMSIHENQQSPVDPQHDVGFPKAFGSMSIEDPSFYSHYDEFQGQAYDQSARPTPSSLGWTEQTRVAEYYDLVVEKSPNEPYLILKKPSANSPDNCYMPDVVYLDQDG
jgi:hypothetical protein